MNYRGGDVFSKRSVASLEDSGGCYGKKHVKVYIFVYTYISVCTVCTYIHSVLSRGS